MKLSVVYISCREPNCVGNWVGANHNLVWVPEPETNHYRLLAASLAAQTFTDYELIVVDEANELPRPELEVLGDRVRYVRPRETPWRALRAFAPSVARNTGILAACGDVIVSLDDCVSFGPNLLAEVATRAERGAYLTLHLRASEVPPHHPVADFHVSRSGGILAYPRAAALQIGGWEERFSGAKALEDYEFSQRLIRIGVPLVASLGVQVTLHGHARSDREPQRCCHAVRELVAGQASANQPWTPDQLAVFGDSCPFSAGTARRGKLEFPLCAVVLGGYCDCPQRPSGEARRIMQTYESAPFAPW